MREPGSRSACEKSAFPEWSGRQYFWQRQRINRVDAGTGGVQAACCGVNLAVPPWGCGGAAFILEFGFGAIRVEGRGVR